MKIIALPVLAALAAFSLGGCDDDDSIGDALEDAGDDIEDAADDIGDDVEDAFDD